MLKPQTLNRALLKCIVETLIFLEFTDGELLDEDIAIQMQEIIASKLIDLNEKDKLVVKNIIIEICEDYEDINIRNFIISLNENIGI